MVAKMHTSILLLVAMTFLLAFAGFNTSGAQILELTGVISINSTATDPGDVALNPGGFSTSRFFGIAATVAVFFAALQGISLLAGVIKPLSSIVPTSQNQNAIYGTIGSLVLAAVLNDFSAIALIFETGVESSLYPFYLVMAFIMLLLSVNFILGYIDWMRGS